MTTNDADSYMHTFVDDLSGKILEPNGVRQARNEEVKLFQEHDAYTFVPLSECLTFTGKKPIATRWVDINKGDETQPKYRSRCVAKEIHRGHGDEMFAGTPPLEANKCLFSLAMTDIAGQRAAKPRGRKKLMFIDVRRAYFHAPVQRPLYVQLPEEFACPDGQCAKMSISMYGTRDAASNWEIRYSQFLRDASFAQGASSPCVFYHQERDVRLVVHGDDFTFLGGGRPQIWIGAIR